LPGPLESSIAVSPLRRTFAAIAEIGSDERSVSGAPGQIFLPL
jgi:hypothetical protein